MAAFILANSAGWAVKQQAGGQGMQCSCEWRLQAVQETRQQADLAKAAESGAKDPFGSAAAMAPAFAGVAAARQAKPATALQTSHGGSSSSTCAPISAPALGAPATSSADRGNPMPFGSPAGKGTAAACSSAYHRASLHTMPKKVCALHVGAPHYSRSRVLQVFYW